MERIEWALQAFVVPGLGATAVAFLCRLAATYIQRIRDERLRAVLTVLVKAAEQVYGPGQGEAKREYVLAEARARGLRGATRGDLEAAVYELKSGAPAQ